MKSEKCLGFGSFSFKEFLMPEQKILEILGVIDSLGIRTSMMGILRALSKGLITRKEYDEITEWAYTARSVRRYWYRCFIWSYR